MSEFVPVASMQPLRLAAAQGDLTQLKIFCKAEGANVNEAGPETGRTALHWGALIESNPIVSYLLNGKNASVDPIDLEGNTPLNLCIQAPLHSLGKKLPVIETFLAHGADTTLENHQGRSPLMNLSSLRDYLQQHFYFQLKNMNSLIARIKQGIYVKAHDQGLNLCIQPNGQVVPDPRAYNVPRLDAYVPAAGRLYAGG